MDKSLIAHRKYVAKKLEQLQAEMTAAKTGRSALREQAQNLAKYHDAMTRNFQHERLIHLLVTLFFALLAIGSLTAMIFVSATPPLFATMAVMTAILFVLEAFYIRHYYALENNTQKLYPLTKQLYEIIES